MCRIGLQNLLHQLDVQMVVVALCFYDFTEPVNWLKNLKKYLRPDATVAIIDGDPLKSGNPHHISRRRVISYSQLAGFKQVDGIDDSFLEKDTILVFQIISIEKKRVGDYLSL
jgi:hypothetical protein